MLLSDAPHVRGSSRTSIERKLTRPRYSRAIRFRASWVGRQFAPRVNQNESTRGRLKRSQTRIAPLRGIWHAEGRRASAGHGFWEVEQSSWAMFASLSRGPGGSAFGTANSDSGMPRSPPLIPSVPPLCVRIVLSVATMISTRNAIPTKVE